MRDLDNRIYDLMQEQTRLPPPSGFIQWKGTNVCMDVRCKCGHHGHVDSDFAYFYQCPSCKQVFGVGEYVKIVELPQELQQHLLADSTCIVTSCTEEET